MNNSSNNSSSLYINIELNRIMLIQIIIYSCLFIVGEIGNVVVIVMISNLLCQMRRGPYHFWNHVFLYILALSVVDSLALLFLPLTIVTVSRKGHWLFGRMLCKTYLIPETMNKLLSPLLLTLLSFDRFVGVCFPTVSTFRNQRFATRAILLLVILSLMIMSPAFVFTDVQTLNDTTRCITNHLHPMIAAYVIVLFAFGLCVPLALTAIFYSILIVKLQRRIANSRSSTQIALRRLTYSLLFLVGFYFLCYSPYYFSNVLFSYFSKQPTLATVYISSFLHILPYVNSSVNPILYAMLNRNLRECHSIALHSNSINRLLLDLNVIDKFNNRLRRWSKDVDSKSHRLLRLLLHSSTTADFSDKASDKQSAVGQEEAKKLKETMVVVTTDSRHDSWRRLPPHIHTDLGSDENDFSSMQLITNNNCLSQTLLNHNQLLLRSDNAVQTLINITTAIQKINDNKVVDETTTASQSIINQPCQNNNNNKRLPPPKHLTFTNSQYSLGKTKNIRCNTDAAAYTMIRDIKTF